jgi:hypothetical protein
MQPGPTLYESAFSNLCWVLYQMVQYQIKFDGQHRIHPHLASVYESGTESAVYSGSDCGMRVGQRGRTAAALLLGLWLGYVHPASLHSIDLRRTRLTLACMHLDLVLLMSTSEMIQYLHGTRQIAPPSQAPTPVQRVVSTGFYL